MTTPTGTATPAGAVPPPDPIASGIIDPRLAAKPDSFNGDEGKFAERAFVFSMYAEGVAPELGDL
eukprot:15469281-Alexandrium_andersonii.AAC.1